MVSTEGSSYSREFYEKVSKATGFDAIASLIIDIVNPRSVVDFGCAVGTALSRFKSKGIKDILGVDGYWVEEDQLLIEKNEFLRHDFEGGSISLPRRYDLAISTEVAEHIHETKADDFIASIVAASDVVVFSAAIPGQGGDNHYNEQWPSYWVEKFKSFDYQAIDCLRSSLWHDSSVEYIYKQNMLLFCKSDKISKLKLPEADIPIYDFVHPLQFQHKLFQLYNLFNQLFNNKDYDMILQLSFLKDYDYSAKLFLGLVYYEKKDFNNCIDCLEAFVQIAAGGNNYNFGVAYYILGLVYSELANNKRAKECLNKCISVDSEFKNDATELLSKLK